MAAKEEVLVDEPVRYDERLLLERLGRLPPEYVQVFAASSANALLPGYEDYAATTDRADPARLRQLLDLAWQAAGTAQPPAALREAMAATEALIPEEDDAWVDASAHAQCAAAAVYYALQHAVDQDPTSAAAVTDQEYQAVDQQVLYDIDADEVTPEVERNVLTDPRVQRVLRGQLDRLDLVEEAVELGRPVRELVAQLQAET